VGKTTLCQGLLDSCPELERAVTCTTRAPRTGEHDGEHYHFLTPETFESRRQEGAFLEWATVYGHSYGTLRTEVTRRLGRGANVLLNVDVQGVGSICEQAADDPALGQALVTVFLSPQSLEVLETRLRKRGTDGEEVVKRRLAMAQAEIGRWREYDYLIVSESVEWDVSRLRAILEAERMRSCRARPPEESR